MAENDFVQWLEDAFATDDPTVLAGVGADDCAHLSCEGIASLAVTTDTLLQGVHFGENDPPHEIGWKAVAVNLSDLAASGCRPRWGVVGLGLQRSLGITWAKDLAEGMAECARAYGLSLVGGDFTSGNGPTSITITVMGDPVAGCPLLRDGAREGDVIAVTGSLGGSILGRHLHPLPRIPEIEALLDIAPVHACMDLSDGLSMDLRRMMARSGTGALLYESMIPISEAAYALSRKSGTSPFLHALGDGEDFELLLTLSEADWNGVLDRWPAAGVPLCEIGRVTEGPAIMILCEDGETRPLPQGGYEHATD